ncbi:hypothetical protein CYJ73_10105 [Gordonia terrae]|uniref:Uncharacterized protein n=1 Tax=Gordonia terrae TaxID=2055 RepID=A0A2I1R9X3_9ACTN|nr:hypothetical protein [Gordonia terrae]PKZ65889.1 hypothetical protein CYJ73_10105 [Gordonia terrae]UPW08959.1 hypothetical protein M1C59_23535 [Gordonia terrae]
MGISRSREQSDRPQHLGESPPPKFVAHLISDAWAYIKNVLIALPSGIAFFVGLFAGYWIAG